MEPYDNKRRKLATYGSSYPSSSSDSAGDSQSSLDFDDSDDSDTENSGNSDDSDIAALRKDLHDQCQQIKQLETDLANSNHRLTHAEIRRGELVEFLQDVTAESMWYCSLFK
jgi:hypothetical protein